MDKNMSTEIVTNRLQIRLSTDKEMQKLIENETDLGLKQAYSQMLKASLNNPDTRQWFATWIIELNDAEQTKVGDLSFKGLKDDGSVEIGYGFNEVYWNKGYATEAVEAIVNWAINQPGVKIVEAEAESNNIASIRVLEKNNFVSTGVMGEEGPRFIYKQD